MGGGIPFEQTLFFGIRKLSAFYTQLFPTMFDCDTMLIP